MKKNDLLNNIEEESTGLAINDLDTSSPIAIYTTDQEGYITYCNQSAVELWGRTPVMGEDMWCGSWRIFHSNGSAMKLEECPMAMTLKTGVPYYGKEIVIQRPDHSFRTLLVYPQPIFDNNKILIGARNTLVDITAQRNGEMKQALLSAIVESSDDAIVSKNLDGIILSWNTGAQRIFGYEEKEMLGQSINKLIPPSLQNEEEVIIQSIKRGEKIDHFKTVRIGKSGQLIPVSITVSPVKNYSGTIIGASKIARDISEQLKATELISEKTRALETLNSLRKQISEQIDSNIILQSTVEAAVELTGASFGIFYHKNIDENGNLGVRNASAGKYIITDSYFNGDTNAIFPWNIFRDKNTSVVRDTTLLEGIPPILLSDQHSTEKGLLRSYLSVPIVSNQGKVLGGIFLGHTKPDYFQPEHEDLISNITSQASNALDNFKLFNEIKVLSARKDEFIALASHELRNPLTSISAYIQLLERQEVDETGKQFIQKIEYQLERINILMGDLFDISSIESGKLQLHLCDFDLAAVIREVIENLQHSSPTHKIILENKETVIMIRADKQRIEQILINLIGNAIKYSPNKEKVWVSVSVDAKEASISIRDKGKGLSPEELKKIFTRYYRVENASKVTGLGLGLYLSKEFIESHQGRLEVTSELNKGSDFRFFLPIKH